MQVKLPGDTKLTIMFQEQHNERSQVEANAFLPVAEKVEKELTTKPISKVGTKF